ncbi:unnamed protein product [Cunninghamella blakesleeana]
MSLMFEKIILSCLLPTFVLGSLISSFYLYYNQFYASTSTDSKADYNEGVVDVLFITTILFLSIFSYLKIILTPLEKPSKNDKAIYWCSPDLNSPYYYKQIKSSSLSINPGAISICDLDGESKYCSTCQIIKPERCHHCKICDICVLKMDHHCIWINGCVGFGNYKTFVLFLTYTTVYIFWLLYKYLHFIITNIVIKTSIIQFLWILYKTYFISIMTIFSNSFSSIWERSFKSPFVGLPILDINIPPYNLLLVFFGIVFGTLLFGLTAYHYYIIFKNRTTIENMATKEQYFRIKLDNDEDGYDIKVVQKYPPEKDTYNIGLFNNWKSVMGKKWYLFGVPWENNQSNGYFFLYNPFIYQQLINLSTNQKHIGIVSESSSSSTN